MGRLALELRRGEYITIGDSVRIYLNDKHKGNRANLVVYADPNLKIHRKRIDSEEDACEDKDTQHKDTPREGD